MKIRIVTPAPAGSRKGNRVTALRWARLLRELGHRVVIQEEYTRGEGDLLVALHARRSFDSVARWRSRRPGVPVIVALTGTDLYEDLQRDPSAGQSLEWATRLIVLQPLATLELPERQRAKARVIYQSAEAPSQPARIRRGQGECLRGARRGGLFRVCVLGHLRPVKDPFRAALAARLLPGSSRIRILHVGAALTEEMAEQARAEEAVNPRYRWLGELPRWRALRTLTRCRLLALTSRLEGGANVISEALAASLPILSSRIPGSVGLLGPDYPGYFPVGDTQALACLLERVETDADFYSELKTRCERLGPLVEPARERRAWNALLEEVCASAGPLPIERDTAVK